ncbi:MAG: cysteine--tRNA ligase [Nitrospirota bacterium]|nr:cysteine--tRNA ligase [Nitrospirota bacterium]
MRGRPLNLFNSMGRELERFQPIRDTEARVYSCGPTVYNYAHLGNLRAYVFTDTLRRTLMLKGLDVVHVMNITDVGHLTSDADAGDDKMESAAAREKKTVWDIAAYYTGAFHADVERLGILPPTQEPKATDYIDKMIAFAQKLEKDGHTYTIGDGLYFDTTTVSDYGHLGCLDLEGQEAGSRVEMAEGKRNPTDFCLWKRTPAGVNRLMEWDSPWGKGAPGWHLECSVMSIDLLGAPFDIHTGGIDHRQVHHVNEVAQNQGYTGDRHSGVNHWLHNEFLVLGEDKMSKSKGGFLRLQTLLDQGIHPLVYRYFCLQAHYRKPLVFSWDALVAARAGLKRLLMRVETLRQKAEKEGFDAANPPVLEPGSENASRSLGTLSDAITEPLSKAGREWVDKLDEALSDDLNTPQALACLNELASAKKLPAEDALRLFALYDLVLGLRLLKLDPAELVIRPRDAPLSDAEIQERIAARVAARKDKDFAKSDAIRDELEAMGIVLMDGADGTSWEWRPMLGAPS